MPGGAPGGVGIPTAKGWELAARTGRGARPIPNLAGWNRRPDLPQPKGLGGASSAKRLSLQPGRPGTAPVLRSDGVPGSATPTMAIAVAVSPTRAIAPVYQVRAADLIAHNPTDYGADRSRHDGSHARADADAF